VRGERLAAAVVEALEPRKMLASVSFAAVTSYPLVSGTTSGNDRIAVANFNGSGRPDVAAIDGLMDRYGCGALSALGDN
jgi:hypothetical protein